MTDLNVPPMLWLVGFQMGLYALAWVLCGTLLGDDRRAVVHWGVFLLLTGVVLLLAGARGEPRHWLYYNGANVLSLVAFAVMRRGTELFMRLAPADLEQFLVLVIVAGAVAAVGADERHASWRIVLTYGGQGYLMLRTMVRIGGPLRAEFGPRTLWAIVGPGVLISLMLAGLATRQVLHFGQAMEMQSSTGFNYALMYYYLGGAALFNFGFMVMLTQRLVMRLRHASQRDPLTGLLNRRAVDDALEHEWRRYGRAGASFAVLLVDIDHFKQINDTHGHAAGDQVLAQVARALETHARATDSVARIGGEEFLLLLPDIQKGDAYGLAERLRRAVEHEPVSAARARIAATVSIGVAVVDTCDAGVRAVIARADDALYRAKAAGRNRCVTANVDAARAA
jgi:diguanylate cyclase (GGDEF)-like protein